LTKRRSEVSGIPAQYLCNDIQSLGQEQRRPARADDAGSDDDDATMFLSDMVHSPFDRVQISA